MSPEPRPREELKACEAWALVYGGAVEAIALDSAMSSMAEWKRACGTLKRTGREAGKEEGRG